jgi:PAS domain S-box-containing protein
VNDAAVQHYGYSREEFLQMSILDLRTPEAAAVLKAAIANAPHRAPEKETCQYRKKSGEVIDVEVVFSEITLAGKQVWLASVIDMTERKRAEERLQFLMNELAHRGKNLLAIVQSIVSRSVSGTRSLTEVREVLSQRIQALARSQSVLVTQNLLGAPVAEIIRLEFEGFSGRVEAVGPEVMLNPKIAQTFALLVHELATNATKHGALSRLGGQIAIHWSIDGEGTQARFKLRWQERNGPPVATPTHKGFGRILLEKAAAKDFDAQPTIRFAREGLIYEIDAPLSVVTAAGSGRAARGRGSS